AGSPRSLIARSLYLSQRVTARRASTLLLGYHGAGQILFLLRPPGGAAMSTNGHTEARKLRSGLNHPIIDADGHWIEYAPVIREEFRRIGGDAAVEAWDTASQRVPNSLKMTVAERARRRVGQEAFWSSPSENVLDRATAMMPRL